MSSSELGRPKDGTSLSRLLFRWGEKKKSKLRGVVPVIAHISSVSPDSRLKSRDAFVVV